MSFLNPIYYGLMTGPALALLSKKWLVPLMKLGPYEHCVLDEEKTAVAQETAERMGLEGWRRIQVVSFSTDDERPLPSSSLSSLVSTLEHNAFPPSFAVTRFIFLHPDDHVSPHAPFLLATHLHHLHHKHAEKLLLTASAIPLATHSVLSYLWHYVSRRAPNHAVAKNPHLIRLPAALLSFSATYLAIRSLDKHWTRRAPARTVARLCARWSGSEAEDEEIIGEALATLTEQARRENMAFVKSLGIEEGNADQMPIPDEVRASMERVIARRKAKRRENRVWEGVGFMSLYKHAAQSQETTAMPMEV